MKSGFFLKKKNETPKQGKKTPQKTMDIFCTGVIEELSQDDCLSSL